MSFTRAIGQLNGEQYIDADQFASELSSYLNGLAEAAEERDYNMAPWRNVMREVQDRLLVIESLGVAKLTPGVIRITYEIHHNGDLDIDDVRHQYLADGDQTDIYLASGGYRTATKSVEAA